MPTERLDVLAFKLVNKIKTMVFLKLSSSLQFETEMTKPQMHNMPQVIVEYI